MDFSAIKQQLAHIESLAVEQQALKSSEVQKFKAELAPVIDNIKRLLVDLPPILTPAIATAHQTLNHTGWQSIGGISPDVSAFCQQILSCESVLPSLRQAIQLYDEIDYDTVQNLNERRKRESAICQVSNLGTAGHIDRNLKYLESALKKYGMTTASLEQIPEAADSFDGATLKVLTITGEL